MLAKNPTWTIIKPQVCRWQWGSCTWNNPLRCSQNRKHRRLKQKKKHLEHKNTKTPKKTDTHTLPSIVFCSITCCFGPKVFWICLISKPFLPPTHPQAAWRYSTWHPERPAGWARHGCVRWSRRPLFRRPERRGGFLVATTRENSRFAGKSYKPAEIL